MIAQKTRRWANERRDQRVGSTLSEGTPMPSQDASRMEGSILASFNFTPVTCDVCSSLRHYVLSRLCSLALSCSVLQCGTVWCRCVSVCSLVCALSCVLSCTLLHCGALWCSVVQCGAVWCSVVQCGAVRCSEVQRIAVCCSVLHTVVGRSLRQCVCERKRRVPRQHENGNPTEQRRESSDK